jgi:hypothetical protein
MNTFLKYCLLFLSSFSPTGGLVSGLDLSQAQRWMHAPSIQLPQDTDEREASSAASRVYDSLIVAAALNDRDLPGVKKKSITRPGIKAVRILASQRQIIYYPKHELL